MMMFKAAAFMALLALANAQCSSFSEENCFNQASCTGQGFGSSFKCVNKGCNDYFSEDECKAPCQYDNSDFGGCYPVKSGPCSGYTANNCPKECAIDYDNNECKKKTCSDFFPSESESGIKASCEAVSGCKVFKIDETFGGDTFTQYHCGDLSGPACDILASKTSCDMFPSKCAGRMENDFYTCYNKAEGVPCSSIMDKDSCNKESTCKYVEELTMCQSSDYEITCEDIFDCEACTSKSGCVFKDFQCSEGTGASDVCDAAPTMPPGGSTDMPSTTPDGNGNTGGGNCPDCSCAESDCYSNPVCAFDFEASKCGFAKCRDIFDSTGCTGSPNKCSWDETTALCYPPDSPKACKDQTPDECDKDCFLDFDMEGMSCKEITCATKMGEGECNSAQIGNSGCTWTALSEFVGTCHAEGANPDCDAANMVDPTEVESACNKLGNCAFLSALSKCKEKGTKTPCDFYGNDQEKCTAQSGCAYNTGHATVCYDAASVTCNAFYMASGCDSQDGCVWKAQGSGMQACQECAGGKCELPAGTVCTDLSNEECIAPCAVDMEDNTCRAKQCFEYSGTSCPTDKCELTGDMCGNKDTGLSCDKYKGSEDCPSPRCLIEFGIEGETCRKATCADYMTEGTCKGECKWDAGCENPNDFECNMQSVCYSGNSPECTTLQSQQCKKYSAYCDLFDDTLCVAKGAKPACSTYFSQKDACVAQSDCAFYESESGVQFCYTEAEGVPCEEIWDMDTCTQEKTCRRDSVGQCVTCSGSDCEDATTTTEAPTFPDNCDFATAEACSAVFTCAYDFETETCNDAKCFEIFDKAACKAKDCVYVEDQMSCLDKDSGKACATITDTNECAAAIGRCTVDYESGTATMEGTCKDATCVDFFSETACGGDCEWNAIGQYCNSAGAPPRCEVVLDDEEACNQIAGCEIEKVSGFCATKGAELPCDHPAYSTEDACPSDRCKFVAFQCYDKDYEFQCTDFFNVDDCTSQAACKYDLQMGLCSKCESGNCETKIEPCASYTQEAECPTGSHCVFENNKCSDAACDMRFNKFTCTTSVSTTSCAWDAAGICKKPGTVLQCTDYFEKSGCDTRPDCEWIGGSTMRCKGPDDVLQCFEYGAEECPKDTCVLSDDLCQSESASSTSSMMPTTTSTTAPITGQPTGYDCKSEAAAGTCWKKFCADDGVCSRCRNGNYLHNGACLAECPSGTIPVTDGSNNGRICATGNEYIGDMCDADKLGPCEQCRVTATTTECLKCRSDRFLFQRNGYMRCNPELTCLASTKKFEELAYMTDKGPNCNCFDGLSMNGGKNNADCQRCRYTNGIMDNKEANSQGTKVCLRCRNSKLLTYNVADSRVYCQGENAACPAGLVAFGIGAFGRRCQPAGACINNVNMEHAKNKNDPTKNSNVYCKCGPGVKDCSFDANGMTATKCKARKYLHDGKCLEECPAGTTGQGGKSVGRKCV